MTRRAGPELSRRWLRDRAFVEGTEMWWMYWGPAQMSYRSISAAVGRPTTTVWRHINLAHDFMLPTFHGNPSPRRLPPMRGTARCPRGRPFVPGHDGPVELPRPRHLVPAQRCTKRRRDGKACDRWCERGAYVCLTHGGAAPQVREAARRRVAELENEALELERTPGSGYDRAHHHAALRIGAERRALFIGSDFRRAERTARRRGTPERT